MVYGLLIIFEYIVVIGLQTRHDTVSILVVIVSFFKKISIRMKFLHLFDSTSHFKSFRLIASVCLCIIAPDYNLYLRLTHEFLWLIFFLFLLS